MIAAPPGPKAVPTSALSPHTAAKSILLVDDEESILTIGQRILQLAGLQRVSTCLDSTKALELVAAGDIDLVVLDLSMPQLGGEQLLRQLIEQHPDVGAIVATGAHDLPTAVRCMKLGALDYIAKPFSGERLVEAVVSGLARVTVSDDLARFQRVSSSSKLQRPEAFREILTADPKMLAIFKHVETIAKGTHPVFIWGETGTGKEMVARALHAVSAYSGPFVAVNVAGLDDTMFADVLFGHRAGAFTGAHRERGGMIEAAAGGVLFLDEIGDLSESSQVKLLRLIQEREYFPHGSDHPVPLRARIVAATHRPPSTLRQDLYYRLRAYRVDLPPLRERVGDLPLLIEHFLRSAARDLGKRKPAVPYELFVYLSNYGFPGNVRELQSMVFDGMAHEAHGVLRLDTFLEHIQPSQASCPDLVPAAGETGGLSFPTPLPSLRAINHAAIRQALERTGGNRSAAARLLGVSRPTVLRHLRQSS